MEKLNSDINAKEAKKLDLIEKELVKKFKQAQKKEINYEEIKQKTFEPVTSAIGKVEGKIGEVLNQNQNLMELVPVVNKFANISIPESSFYEEEQLQLPSSILIKEDKGLEDSKLLETVVSPKILNTILGKIAQKYLPRADDVIFCLYWDKRKILL